MPVFKAIIRIAKENNIRLTFQNAIFLPEEEKATKQVTNSEIIEYLKTETGNDLTKPALNQLIEHVEKQTDYKLDPQSLLKSENLVGPFKSTQELFDWLEN